MINKHQLVLKYFQKAEQLTVGQKQYSRSLKNLFLWLMDNDQASQDTTSKLLKLRSRATAKIICHEPAVIAGIEEISWLVKNLKPLVCDGQAVAKNQVIAQISDSADKILGYERTIINLLQRLSGIATQTKKLVSLVTPKVFIAATRKTPWGFLDKKAVAGGGGLTHRLNLSDGILIKDNHLKIISIPKALETILPQVHRQLIEVETKTKTEVAQTLDAFNKFNRDNYLAIMFDNFSAADIKNIIKHLDNQKIIFEASGGINQSNLTEYAQTGADIISLGSLTHSARAVDLSLEII